PASVSAGGLRGRPLAWSEAAAGLGLWSTEWTPDMKLERPDALEHHRLVERICAAQPCLPVRFGTAFASVEAARASLDKRAEALHAALARVSGKSEIALTLLWREPAATEVVLPTAGPGRRYMEARRAEFASREARRARAESLVDGSSPSLRSSDPLSGMRRAQAPAWPYLWPSWCRPSKRTSARRISPGSPPGSVM